MDFISRPRWAEFCKTLVPLLKDLAEALRKWGPDYSDRIEQLAKEATEDPQSFIYSIHDGFLWGGMGSVIDGVSRPETMLPLLELADALKSIGLDSARTNEARASLRRELFREKK